ncbi:hypothetical protein DFR24_1300 [Panacagrimonas perspica]|uniref:Uncharacterized protein n=1 Tax=Panacagrimonas perspica TaxID=381431 RepID=A0A4V3F6A2_9GAMM|nr:hypothetical protein [Panacagrimonas perspica]TDU31916.1 hypothetical protein DFR24_1300 [Panacagrimonas perspica]THD04237.1 hypothetical protein B1810_06265 [Panacagrimonas perspica]
MPSPIDTMTARPIDTEASAGKAITPSRLCVMHVRVEPAQVWFDCPRCGVELEGYYSDPRGQTDVACEDCGTVFDIPSSASLVIT